MAESSVSFRRTSFLTRCHAHWATCALTHLGFIRLSSNPAVIPSAKSLLESPQLLEAMVADPLHVYLAALPPAVGGETNQVYRRLMGHNQVTDAYLLQLTPHHHAVLVTFDRRLQVLGDALSVPMELLQ